MLSNRNDLKVGIDLHGVITANPKYFSKFSLEAKKRGFEIHILTGSSSTDAKEKLKKYNIIYDHLFSILDYFSKQNKVEHFKDGNFHVDERLWDSAKANYSNNNHIDFHIDDKEQYGQGMLAAFFHYNHAEQKCTIKGPAKYHIFYITQDIGKTFNLIERLIRRYKKCK